MQYLWPEYLWLLLLAPVLAAAYVAVLRRSRPAALRYPDLGIVRAAQPGRAWRRHVPPAIFLAGLACALLACARPTALVTLPSQQRVVILAIDVSLSMRASDIEPDRITAAKAAARAFIRDLPGDVRLGIVSFAGTAALVQAPTGDKDDLVAAVDRLQLDRQTAIGSGIAMSLAALFPDESFDLEWLALASRAYGGEARTPPPGKAAQKKFVPAAPGSNENAAVILLTDGRRTTGLLPGDAARLAAERGIKVYTVGFGTPEGGTASMDGYSIFMAFDEESLRTIAEITKAEYFHAATGAELLRVYEGLSSKLVLDRSRTEVTFLFGAAAALLMTLSAALSLLWFNRAL